MRGLLLKEVGTPLSTWGQIYGTPPSLVQRPAPPPTHGGAGTQVFDGDEVGEDVEQHVQTDLYAHSCPTLSALLWVWLITRRFNYGG